MSEPSESPSAPIAGPAIEPSPTFLIMALGRRLREQVEDTLRTRDLSMRHLSALGHLAGDTGHSYSELARRSGITAQSMQATLRQLEELGAVERRGPGGRGRAARLHVTEYGRELTRWGRSVLRESDRILLEDVPEHQRAALTDGLLAAFAGR
ncbi:Transcriptional regulator, MarR family [Pseudonocardia sp. Ae168_Ps1]|uniref:MarR family winged helix-turn-helix transcriptional regulator n=1 Tax=unclassified Pseudonocardia TaxID=2619320 RepID=UPI00095FD418|nr:MULTISPECIES: MarR family winged helix-turn-helix transcriptional regulator [unclassified Pseudonocardia]OLL81734.1 Transcriptional regulator, MarR family [Pseudonocardia sp. Ae168_Ps1]